MNLVWKLHRAANRGATGAFCPEPQAVEEAPKLERYVLFTYIQLS